VINKRYLEANYQEYVVFDVEWNPINLKKPSRSIKGILIFCDLFGEPKFRITVTINDPLKPGEAYLHKAMGFDYNKFNDQQIWAKETDVKDMTFRFQVSNILYADGEREDY